MPTVAHRPIDELRRTASQQLDPIRRSQLGQFMTPSAIADFMSSLFRKWPKKIYLLDPGAGIGSLTESFARKFYSHPSGKRLSVSAYEIDQTLCYHLSENLTRMQVACQQSDAEFNSEVIERDFISDAVPRILRGEAPYTHVILNPPYKKIASVSAHRKLLREVGIETTNLYAAFVALSLALTKQGGEVVAIIPRSFCNGLYFRPFREWLLNNAALAQIHIFESRRKAFQEDNVLQENVIVHLVKGAQQSAVVVSSSHDASFSDYQEHLVGFNEIVQPTDEEKFIRIPTTTPSLPNGLMSSKLEDLDLSVATGPVVDFRVRELCLDEPSREAAPLLYAHHFTSRGLEWPRTHRKPNAIVITPNTRKLLMPQGWYVVVRRFSSKEERRRIVASVLNPKYLPHDLYGFENHLNVFHYRKHGLDANIAHGLALFLNATLTDSYFRTFSGHTQVNATDLRSMRFPNKETLWDFGKWAQTNSDLDQMKIDNFIKSYAEAKQ